MKLIVLSGNAVIAIKNKIGQIKKEFDPLSTLSLSGKGTSTDEIILQTSTPALFSEKRLVVIEDIDDKFPVDRLSGDDELTVVLVISKALTPTSELLKSVNKMGGQSLVMTEKDETSIFPFLDKLGNKDKSAFSEVDQIIDELGGQYLLSMILYFYRRMIVENSKTSDFMKGKIDKQKKNFDIEKLKDLYDFSLDVDYKMKNGLMEEKMGLTLVINKILQ
jgi:DNA polymerase III delta subunit